MADLEKTVSIVFKGVDDVSKTVKGVSNSLGSLESSVSAVTQPLADVAAAVLKIEAALAAMAGAGLVVAVREAGKFNDAFAEISTLIDGTAGDFDQFKQEILDYATVSTSSIEEVNAAVYAAISAGVEYQDSLAFITQAEKLATAGKADLQSTTIALVSTLNAYGESTDQAGKYSDILFTTVKQGQTTLPELANSLSQVTGVASNAGIPFETLASAVAALTAAGAPTTQAITQIRGAIANIIKPSSEATKAANELGVEFNASALKSKGFEGVLQEVFQATGGNVDQMARFFGRVEALNAALVLGADKGGKFASTMDEMKVSAGATDAAFSKMEQNLDLAVQNLVNNFRALLVDFGTPLLNETTDIAWGMSDVFKGVRISIDDGAFDPVFASLERFGQTVADTLRVIAENIPEALEMVDFDGLVAAFENLGSAVGDAFSALFGDVDLSTPEGLASVIQKITDGVTALTNVSAGIVQAWEPFLGLISDAVDKFSDADEATHSWIGNILGLAQAVNSATGLLSGMSGILSGVASGLTALAAIKYMGIAGGIGAVAAAFAPFAIGGAIGAGLAYIVAKIADELTPAIDQIPEKKEIEIVMESGDVLDVVNGVVRTLDGEELSLKAYIDPSGLLDGIPDNTPRVIKELLTQGEADVLINYVADPNTANLEAAIKEAGGVVIKGIQDSTEGALQPIKDLPKQIEPLELIDMEAFDKDIDYLKVEAEKFKTAVEWTAKLEIAEAEANAKVLAAAFTSIGETVKAAADATASMVGALAGVDTSKGFSKMWAIEDAIERQFAIQEKALENQTKLTDAEVALLQAKKQALEKGESLIKIEAPGLQPHLEAFMWEILEAIQVRASEEGAEFLLGI